MARKQPVRKYSELIAWQKAMDPVEQVYSASRDFPREEIYGLTSQIRRAAVSIPSNVAEGQSRTSTREFMHHLSIARGSLSEVETQIIVAQRLGYVRPDLAQRVLDQAYEVGYLIHGLTVAIGRREPANSPLATRHSPLQ